MEHYHSLLRTIEAFDRTTHKGVIVFDFQEKKIEYVSQGHSFLCGYTADDIYNFGTSLYLRIIKREDWQLLNNIHKACLEFFYRLPIEERWSYTASYDFKLQNKNGIFFLVHHKITPLSFDEKANLKKVLCVISLSGEKEKNKVLMYKKNAIWECDLTHFLWKKQQQIQLTKREKEIIYLSAQGYSVNEIADRLFIATDTVKYHRKKLFEKLDVTNTVQAINYMLTHCSF